MYNMVREGRQRGKIANKAGLILGNSPDVLMFAGRGYGKRENRRKRLADGFWAERVQRFRHLGLRGGD
jgi:hypothetical protein